MRNEKIDNLKGMMMLLVVYGHLLELIMDHGAAKFLYEWIYTFHMPLFLFLTGYFFGFDIKKIILQLIYPYIIFQTLYLLFARYILHTDEALQYTTPYWLLWYLFAVIIFNFMAYFCQPEALKGEIAFLIGTVMIAIIAGFAGGIERAFSLSRIQVFFPFFLFGRYFHNWQIRGKKKEQTEQQELKEQQTEQYTGQQTANCRKGKAYTICCSISVLITAGYTVWLLFSYNQFQNKWFYEAGSYQSQGSSPQFRLLQMGIAAAFVLAFYYLVPNRKLFFFNKIGKNTLQVFLLHGFLIKILQEHSVMEQVPFPLVSAFGFSLVITFVLASRPIGIITGPFMKGKAYGKKKSISNCS